VDALFLSSDLLQFKKPEKPNVISSAEGENKTILL